MANRKSRAKLPNPAPSSADDPNVFISWSGERSKAVATALRDWLRKIIPAVRAWMSAEDIEPGMRWSAEIADKLERCRIGIICVTPGNHTAVWLNFEAGAISKAIGEPTRVCPYYLDMKPTDIQGPLTQFQGVKADPEGTWSLVESINNATGGSVDKAALRETFYDYRWPQLKATLEEIVATKPSSPRPRPQNEVLEEILETVREIKRSQSGARFEVGFLDAKMRAIAERDADPEPSTELARFLRNRILHAGGSPRRPKVTQESFLDEDDKK